MYRSGWSPESGSQVPFWYLRYEDGTGEAIGGWGKDSSVYTVTIRDGIHKLLQKTSVLLQKTTGQMLINVKVRTYNEAREYPELGQP